MVRSGELPPVRLLAPRGFATHRLAYMLDSLVRVSRRAGWKRCASVSSVQVPRPAGRTLVPRSGRRHRRGIDPRSFPAAPTHADRRPAPIGGPVSSAYDRAAPAASIRFPLNNFKHFLTLFSKFFSPFPRGTCSLSVSRRCLALDGIYHPLRAAFPNNPTRRQRFVEPQASGSTGLSPSLTSRSRELGPDPRQKALL